MPVTTAQIIIDEAFRELGVTVVGESVSTAIATSALARLNSVTSSLQAEGVMNILMRTEGAALVAGTSLYTVSGSAGGGTFEVTKRPLRILSWRAFSGAFETSGRMISFQELRDQVGQKNGSGYTAVLPQMVAAEMGYVPAGGGDIAIGMKMEVWPKPAPSPGTLQLDYYGQEISTTFPALATGTEIDVGWDEMLVTQLALALAPSYPRVGGIPEALASRAQNAKAVIVQKNAAIMGLNAAPGAS